MEFTKDSWTILSPIEQSIKAKIEKYGTPLKDWDISINYGIKTGCNEAFIISGDKRRELIAEDPKSAEIIRPILRGRDIKRYGYEFADLWLIATFPSKHYNIDDYPAVKKWLKSFGKKLEQTGEEYIDEHGDKQKCRKKTNNKWFETQDSIAYWEDFSKQKICWNRISSVKEFSFVEKEMFIADSMHFITSSTVNMKVLCLLLNSKIIRWFLHLIVGDAVGGNAGNSDNIKCLPLIYHNNDTDLLYTEIVKMFDVQDIQKVDKIIYDFYHLSSDEINFIEASVDIV